MFEDPEDEVAKRSAHKLLQWWNWYVLVQFLAAQALILLLSSNIFPATVDKSSVVDSCSVMWDARRRL